MSNLSIKLFQPRAVASTIGVADGDKSIGDILVDMGRLHPADHELAKRLQKSGDASLAQLMVSRHMISQDDALAAYGIKYGAQVFDLGATVRDPALAEVLGLRTCLSLNALPLRRVGGGTLVVTSRPETMARVSALLPAQYHPVLMGLARSEDIESALVEDHREKLVDLSETRVPAHDSCRTWNLKRLRAATLPLAAIALALIVFSPEWILPALTAWAILTLIATTALRIGALLKLRSPDADDPPVPMIRQPVVSVLVPLLREKAIAAHLIKRLSQLSYPKHLLDICLVVESDDEITKATLAQTHLPSWMRTIVVPQGSLKTKPRAMNYALDFCRGSLIGIYDAEDAPDPDQITKVVRRFAQLPAEVVCLQGVLDFYNTQQNWLARCFTIEYATWFRVVLPGLQKLGFAVPLGGTTLFFRRAALETLGGWDAHNVTEDADLGMRLARRGYRTDIIQTVTHEEANCRVWPWIKQRSRWLKGYAVTYAVHMKNPAVLWRDLGAWKFLGFQILFLATLSQFVLAPLLWSLWLIPLSSGAVFGPSMGTVWVWTLAGVFIAAELVAIASNVIAVNKANRKHLWVWTPSMHIYFWFGTLAVYKALWEILRCPFYWDKTSHGEDNAVVLKAPEQPQHPMSDALGTQLIYARVAHDTPRPHHQFQWHSQSHHALSKP